ncbi:prepilin-type N-terminal cleavage/methylation domain-containing protein [uncultured Cellulomonas sp.]|uniref:type IV pilus modification PilV family protein n=1 Tax=uncultured Cellulomonas sp. TaxID=189682 RepID=UPI00261E7F96|nr:type II secretion system protein [uncultured Cellulomonas sp.]
MRTIPGPLHRVRQGEDGLTLVEVVVAMMILAVISTSVIYGMLQVLSMTRDSRAREVAANLAAEEIDLARDSADLFALLDGDRTVTLNGDRFTVRRTTQWVADPATEVRCGAGGTGLRYKRVRVTVTWDGMRAATTPVQSVTVLNPRDKVNDPTKGTILVSVLGAGGTGRSGVTVTATPTASVSGNTARPLTRAPALTDAQGCSYVLMVTPGVYDVTVARTGYVDTRQAESSTQSVGVVQGTSVAVVVELDQHAQVDAALGAGYVAAPGESVWAPGDLPTSFVSTYASGGVFALRPATTTTDPSMRFRVYPFPSGYEVFAGTCAAADPAAWEPVVDNAQTLTGRRGAGIAVAPGSAVAASVRTGVVRVDLGVAPAGTVRFVRAVAAAGSVPGQPGCDPTTLTFAGTAARPVPEDGRLTLLLPYGSWSLDHGVVGSADPPVALTADRIVPVGVPVRTTVTPSGVVTFDPRSAS